MLLSKRYHKILCLTVIQGIVLVFYGVRLQYNVTHGNMQLSANSEQSTIDNETIGIRISTNYNTTIPHVGTDGNEVFVNFSNGVYGPSFTNDRLVRHVTERTDNGSSAQDSMDEKLITDIGPSVVDTSNITDSTSVRNATDNLFTGKVSTVGNFSKALQDSNLTPEYNNTSGEILVSDRQGERRDKTWIKTGKNLYPTNMTLTFEGKNDMSEECTQSFLANYAKYCDNAIVPTFDGGNITTLCPCIPKTLLGKSALSMIKIPLHEIENQHREVLPGGHWEPSSCIPRQRVAIIVPFRNREPHLRVFLQVLHPFLQRQQLYYTIFVVEQDKPSVFNKASLMNAGFEEIRSRHNFDCFIFHDVDMLPENDRNFYGCYKTPRHVGVYVDKFQYNLLYLGLFGGATAYTERQFTKLNGYSNEFYGWGGEDDDMFNRIKWTHMNYLRFPKCVAHYKMIKHDKDNKNPYDAKLANRAWSMRPSIYKKNGLNNLVYSLAAYEEQPLYTRILVSLPEPPNLLPPATTKSRRKR